LLTPIIHSTTSAHQAEQTFTSHIVHKDPSCGLHHSLTGPLYTNQTSQCPQINHACIYFTIIT